MRWSSLVWVVACGSAALGSVIAAWVAGRRYRVRWGDYLLAFFICFAPSALVGIAIIPLAAWLAGALLGPSLWSPTHEVFSACAVAAAALTLPYLLVQGLLRRFPDSWVAGEGLEGQGGLVSWMRRLFWRR